MANDVYRPDPVWSKHLVSRILRLSKVDPNLVAEVEINCGSCGPIGWLRMKSGERLAVSAGGVENG